MPNLARSLVAIAAVVVVAQFPAPAVTQAAQRPVEVNKPADPLIAARYQLQGRWDLISYEILPPGKAKIQLLGKGTMIYDDYGNLEMNIRVDEPTARSLDEAGIPTKDGVLLTKGRTVIDVQTQSLVFVLQGQPAFGAPSGPLGLNRRRFWQVDGQVLTLITKGDDGSPLSISKWQKLAL